MFKNKTTLYSTILAVLVAFIIIFSMSGDSKDKRKLEATIFSIADTSSVNKVEIISQEFEHIITKDLNKWKINNTYKVDPVLSEVLLAVLNTVKVKRAVAKTELDQLVDFLKNEGVLVRVFAGDKELQSFYVGGRKDENLTFYMDTKEEKPYLVYIPGYNSYIASFFEMDATSWKDRSIFSSNWLGIKRFDFEHGERSKGESFSLVYDKNFFKVANLPNFDTTAVMEYLEIFENFQADQLVSEKEFVKYDSITSLANYLFSVSIDDINAEKSKKVFFYQYPYDNRAYIAKIVGKKEEYALLSANRANNIIKSKNDFLRK
jgi:hypothetical protein